MNESNRYPGLIVGTPAYARAAQRASRQRERDRIGEQAQRTIWREAMRVLRAKDREKWERKAV